MNHKLERMWYLMHFERYIRYETDYHICIWLLYLAETSLSINNSTSKASNLRGFSQDFFSLITEYLSKIEQRKKRKEQGFKVDCPKSISKVQESLGVDQECCRKCYHQNRQLTYWVYFSCWAFKDIWHCRYKEKLSQRYRKISWNIFSNINWRY